MSSQQPAPPFEPQPQRRGRDLLARLIVPAIVTVLGAVMVTALTPLGQSLRELLFPTRAVVTATVMLSGLSADNATATLDNAPAGTTGTTGSFTLVDVRAGAHVLHLEAFGAVPADKSFVVTREAAVVDLGLIELETVAKLGFYLSLTPRTSEPTIDYKITLWIEGDEQTLADIKKVTYTLPDPLPAKPAKGKKGTTFYCYSKAGTVTINDLFGPGGSFAAANAEVQMSGGALQLSSLPGAIRPPGECPKPAGGSGGGESGSGSGGGPGSNRDGSDPGDPAAPAVPIDQDSSEGSDPVVISCAPDPGGETYQIGPPASAQIGQEVRWVNNSEETMSLDVDEEPARWDAAASDQVAPGATYAATFTAPGSQGYTCTFPSRKITGDLIIKDR